MATKTLVYRSVKSMNSPWPKKTIMEKTIEKSVSESTRCFICGSLVYAVERKKTANHVYHNRCFRCRICKRNLTGLSLNEEGDDIYCSNCYQKKQRGDCDNVDFKLAALERAQFVYNRRHPDQPDPQPNPRPPIQRDLSRQPSWTLRQLERQHLSHEKLDPNLEEKVHKNYQKLISVTRPIKIETSLSAPASAQKFRYDLIIPRTDRSPSYLRIQRTPSLPRTDRSPSLPRTDRSPSLPRTDRSPSLPRRDRSPPSLKIERTPSLPRTDRSSSLTRRDRSPSFLKIERTPSSTSSERTSSLHFSPAFSPFPNTPTPSKVSTPKTLPIIREIKIHKQLPRSKSYPAEIFRFPSNPNNFNVTYVKKASLDNLSSIMRNGKNKSANRQGRKETRFNFPATTISANRSQSHSGDLNFDKYRLK